MFCQFIKNKKYVLIALTRIFVMILNLYLVNNKLLITHNSHNFVIYYTVILQSFLKTYIFILCNITITQCNKISRRQFYTESVILVYFIIFINLSISRNIVHLCAYIITYFELVFIDHISIFQHSNIKCFIKYFQR